jgi:hypothetical protein
MSMGVGAGSSPASMAAAIQAVALAVSASSGGCGEVVVVGALDTDPPTVVLTHRVHRGDARRARDRPGRTRGP